MRTLIAIAALVALTAPASALCPVAPDLGTTSYPSGQTDLILCQQDELALTVDKHAMEEQLRMMRAQLQALELEQQRILVTPVAPVTFPSLSFDTPSF
jgi:TolA-binding protein